MSPTIDIVHESALWQSLPDADDWVERSARAALAACGVAVAPEAELSVLLADDATLRKLNGEWRGQDKPTNVLSFPAADPDDLADAPHCGDLALAFETLRTEAEAEAKALEHHLAHLVVHGVLHLVGYDHETEAEASQMEALEVSVLAGLGIADPYGPDAERDDDCADTRFVI